jgi:hypothetical protein
VPKIFSSLESIFSSRFLFFRLDSIFVSTGFYVFVLFGRPPSTYINNTQKDDVVDYSFVLEGSSEPSSSVVHVIDLLPASSSLSPFAQTTSWSSAAFHFHIRQQQQ